MGENVLVRDILKQLETPIYVAKPIQKDDKMSKNIKDIKQIISDSDKHELFLKRWLKAAHAF